MRSKNVDFLKQEVRKYYRSLDKIHCPYFEDTIVFNDDGFRHLSFKGNVSRQERTRKEQFVRFKLFKLAVKLLRITTTLQDYSEATIWIKNKRKKRTEKILQKICYWTFNALIAKKK